MPVEYLKILAPQVVHQGPSLRDWPTSQSANQTYTVNHFCLPITQWPDFCWMATAMFRLSHPPNWCRILSTIHRPLYRCSDAKTDMYRIKLLAILIRFHKKHQHDYMTLWTRWTHQLANQNPFDPRGMWWLWAGRRNEKNSWTKPSWRGKKHRTGAARMEDLAAGTRGHRMEPTGGSFRSNDTVVTWLKGETTGVCWFWIWSYCHRSPSYQWWLQVLTLTSRNTFLLPSHAYSHIQQAWWQIYRISRRIIEATEKRCADVQELPAQFSVPISGGGLCLKYMTFAHFDIVVKLAITKVLWNLTLRSHCSYWTGNSVYRTLVWKGRTFCPVPYFVALVGIGGKFDTASVSLGLWQCHVRHKHVPFPVKPFLNCNDSCGTSAKKLAAIQFEGRPEEFHSYPTSTWPPSACS